MVLRTTVLFVLLLIVGYGAFKLLPLVSGPVLTIDVPIDYTTSPDGFVLVSGKAAYTEAVSLNDGPLLIDQEGRFATTLLLPSGGGILKLTATDRFGRTTTSYRTVFVP